MLFLILDVQLLVAYKLVAYGKNVYTEIISNTLGFVRP